LLVRNAEARQASRNGADEKADGKVLRKRNG